MSVFKKWISALLLLGAVTPAMAANRQWESAEYILDQITTPTNPAASKTKLYSKSGSALFFLSSAGTERQVCSLNGTETLTNKTIDCASNTCSNVPAVTVPVTDDTTTNATYYPSFYAANTGNLAPKVSSTKLTYNPSTGNLSATTFTGALSGNASTATALASTPTGCSAGQFATAIATNGNATCSTPSAGIAAQTPLTKTANYTLVAGDVVVADASGGAFTLTLPDATTYAGKPIYVVKKDSSVNAVTVSRAGSDTFNGGDTSLTMNGQNTAVMLVSVGTLWFVF